MPVCWRIDFDQPVPFAKAFEIQSELHRARQEGRIPDTVLFLEHPPVVTLGRRGRDQHLLLSETELSKKGIDVHTATRGGDVTYHAPGQQIMYPIIHLGDAEADAHGYLHNLEEIAIRTCADYSVEAWRREGKSGAWTKAGKIAAIGFKIQRWVTLHGISFNVNLDLMGFQLIVPCGLTDPVCSLKTLLGDQAPAVAEVRERMAVNFQTVCERNLETVPLSEALKAAAS